MEEKLRKENIGILRKRVIEAFEKLKEGDLGKFVRIIADVGDVRYRWHKNIVLEEIENQLKELCSEKKYCKNIIQQHKKNMILENLK